MVHVKQMKERPTGGYDIMQGLNKTEPSSVKYSDFENEAIEEEERIISYMNSQQKRLFEDTNDVRTTSAAPNNNNNNIPFFSNSFGPYDNNFSYSYMDIFNNISRNINVTDSFSHNVDDNNKKHRLVPNQGLINNGNFVNSSVFPLLSNSHLFQDLDYINSDEYPSFLGQNTSHDNSTSSSYAPTPILFASRDRTINPASNTSNSILPTNNAMSNNSIQPDILSGANSTNNSPSIDIEYLADRVYNIFQNKIQIQKMRRGIS
jgi:hypothetical protein